MEKICRTRRELGCPWATRTVAGRQRENALGANKPCQCDAIRSLTEDAVLLLRYGLLFSVTKITYRYKVLFWIRRCRAFDFPRSGHASAWRRFSPCCGSLRANDRKRKSAARVPCMPRHRRKVAVFPPTSRKTFIVAFGVDRLATNSTSMRRPHARACWRQPLICANGSDVRFPGLGRTDSACPA